METGTRLSRTVCMFSGEIVSCRVTRSAADEYRATANGSDEKNDSDSDCVSPSACVLRAVPMKPEGGHSLGGNGRISHNYST